MGVMQGSRISGLLARQFGLPGIAEGAVQGSILYSDGTSWVTLGPGNAGELLETQGAGADPQWSGTQTQMVTRAETPSSSGAVSFAVAATYNGGTFFSERRLSFNRLVLRERVSAAAGSNVTVAVYQAPDGIVVDPWPVVAIATFVAGGGNTTFSLALDVGTAVLQRGPYMIMVADDTGTTDLNAWNTGNSIPFNGGLAAGTYPTQFTTAIAGPAAAPPATVAFAAMTATASDFSLLARFVTV